MNINVLYADIMYLASYFWGGHRALNQFGGVRYLSLQILVSFVSIEYDVFAENLG